jgi:prepilin-type N-terminal cleavage/methylation domain-containing protein
MKRNAFTILELLVVIAVLCALAAILVPVLSQVRRRAYMSQTTSNLHQVAVALSLYRQADGGDGVYGDAHAMGLPIPPSLLEPYGFTKDMKFGPPNETDMYRRGMYFLYASPRDEDHQSYTWSAYATKHQDASFVFASMGFTDEEQPMTSPFGTFVGIGARLDTSTTTRVRAGDWRDYEWWE